MLKGTKMSDASKAKLSVSHKGQVAWNKGKKMKNPPWNKGKTGVHECWCKGKHLSEIHKMHISQNSKRVGYWYGKKRPDMTGENNCRWKGGRSYIRGNDWRRIRYAIWERDKFTCRRCGKFGKVDAHHIIPYRLTKDNSPENLISLCKSCHQFTEWEFERMEKRNNYGD